MRRLQKVVPLPAACAVPVSRFVRRSALPFRCFWGVRHAGCLTPAATVQNPEKHETFVQELRALGGRTQLPLHAAAAIFLRWDGDRIDKMRAIITGVLRICSV